jgi:hypothetical protein
LGGVKAKIRLLYKASARFFRQFNCVNSFSVQVQIFADYKAHQAHPFFLANIFYFLNHSTNKNI